VQVFNQKIQVKFEFGVGPMIKLRENKTFSLSALTFVGLNMSEVEIACADILPENTS
jgi:hypothetical protein